MTNNEVGISSGEQQDHYVIEIPAIQVYLPKQLSQPFLTEEELKDVVWSHSKDAIYQRMKVRKPENNEEFADNSVTALKQQQADLAKAERRLRLLDQISEVQRQFLQQKEAREVFGYLLTCLLDLMDSEYGFIGQIKHEDDGTMYLQTHAVTNIAWNQATQQFYEDNVESGLKFYNLNSLFGHVMVYAEPVIANNPKKDPRACGIPEGHPPLDFFLGIPFFEPGRKTMNGMVGIANKPGGYSEEDIEFLEPFTVTCSNLIRAYGAMQENIQLIDTLEEKVKERTFELELANQQLEKANQTVLEASAAQLKNFACMSHEIRTPLNCIVGLSSLLLESDLTPQQNDSMRMIVTSGELLSAIVNDVLDYSKLISGNVEIDIQPTDLQDTLDAVVYSIEVKAKDRNLTLCTDYDPLIPKIIDTDGRRLQQILYNLLGNAIKFSKDNGKVEFSISVQDKSNRTMDPSESNVAIDTANDQPTSTVEDSVESSAAPLSKCPFHRPSDGSSGQTLNRLTTHASSSNETVRSLRFVVKDYGKGIEKANFSKIFKPFMQADGETEKLYGGTGLGLAITSKLVEALGGTVSVESEVGEFAQFTVEIPFCRPEADVEAFSRMLNDTHIVVVNEDNSQALSPALVKVYKLNVTEFQSCSDLSVLAQVKGAIDRSRKYLCLVHEDLYQTEDLANFAEAAPGTTILTFGPRYCIKDNFSNGHYRSLRHMLPSSFAHWLIQAQYTNHHTNQSNSGSSSDGSTLSSKADSANLRYDTLKVLVAEDNFINQKVLKNMLNRIGITQLEVVANGKLAVEAAAREHWDLILMDMQMPVMDGVEATKLILKQDHGGKPPKVVFVTAHALENFERQAWASGASGYIAKPFNLKKIESFFSSFMSGLLFLQDAE